MKPNPLCKLKHGELITKQNYPTYVETFNSTVNRCANLKGDGDLDPSQGNVTVDNTDYEHPVIRLTQTCLSAIGNAKTPNLPWQVNEYTTEIERAYMQVGTYQFEAGGMSALTGDNYVVVDIQNLSCTMRNYPINDATHTSLLMFHVNLSGQLSDIVHIPVNKVDYYNISPVIPAWERYEV